MNVSDKFWKFGENFSLFLHVWQSLKWQSVLFLRLMRGAPSPTAIAVFSLLVVRVSRVMAFFIPIKIIMLLGSDHVPRYFESFIRLEMMDVWVLGLMVVVFLVYICSISFVSVANRAAVRGARSLDGADVQKTALSKGGISKKTRIFYNVCDQVAHFILLFSFLSAIAFVEYKIILVLFLFFVFLIAVVGMVISTRRPVFSTLSRRLVANPRRIIEYAEALSFLVVFSCIALIYVAGAGMNVILAILVLILARRALQSLGAIAKQAIAWLPIQETIMRTLISSAR